MAKTRLTLVLFSVAAVFFAFGAALQVYLGNTGLAVLFGTVAILDAVMAALVRRGRIR